MREIAEIEKKTKQWLPSESYAYSIVKYTDEMENK